MNNHHGRVYRIKGFSETSCTTRAGCHQLIAEKAGALACLLANPGNCLPGETLAGQHERIRIVNLTRFSVEEEAHDVPLYAGVYFSSDAMRGSPTRLVTLLKDGKIPDIGSAARKMAVRLNGFPSDATNGRYIPVFPLLRSAGSGDGDVGINGVYSDKRADGNNFVFD